ncbi:hypothetical protein PLESTM_000642800 [Pleodorina starrii]|nr:hypothetical protein PLESTM_000642800 [Pleodorina starrii]
MPRIRATRSSLLPLLLRRRMQCEILAQLAHLIFLQLIHVESGQIDSNMLMGRRRASDIDIIFGLAGKGGRSSYLRLKIPGVTVFVLDPFNRSREHNQAAQDAIVKLGGVQVVTAMSVLNVIPSVAERKKS